MLSVTEKNWRSRAREDGPHEKTATALPLPRDFALARNPRHCDGPVSRATGGYGLELVKRLFDQSRQVTFLRLLNPAFERHPEDRDPGFGREGGGGIGDPALA